MEDDDETSSAPKTLVPDSVPPPAAVDVAVAAEVPERRTEAEDTPVSDPIDAEGGAVPAEDCRAVGALKTEEEAEDAPVLDGERERPVPTEDGGAEGSLVEGAVMQTEAEDTCSQLACDVAVAGDVAAGRVSEMGEVRVEREIEGPASGSLGDGNVGDVAGKTLEIKPEAEGIEPLLGVCEIGAKHGDKGLGDYAESGLVSTEYAEDLTDRGVGIKLEAEGIEPGSGVSKIGAEPVGNGLRDFVESGLVDTKYAENLGASVLVPGSDELLPVDEVEKLEVGDEMDRKDEVGAEAFVATENVWELGASELITSNADVALGEGVFAVVGSEMNSGEGGAESGPSLDVVAGENLSSGTEMMIETGLEVEKHGLPKDSPILDETKIVSGNSSVADDATVEGEVPIVDAGMETEKEVGEEVEEVDAVVGGRDVSQMEVEDEMVNEDSQQLVNTVNIDAEGMARDYDKGEAMAEEDENPLDTKMETEEKDMTEVAEEEKGVSEGGKRKKIKYKVVSKASARRVVEEDVCFICFDGGDLVLCDCRGCPKAYHASCVNRDEAFFRAKGRWNCGWHQCNICEKMNAYYMCYTCTFSLCKACIKDAVISCVRDNQGFCESCMKTVSLIENTGEQINEEQLDFDDKSSWLYLFKDYWLSLKQKLSLSSAEIAQAKNPAEGPGALSGKRESPEEAVDGGDNRDSNPESEENREACKKKRRKTSKRLKSSAKEVTSSSAKRDSPPTRKLKRNSTVGTDIDVTFKPDNTEWASKELLEFVMHMKNGDKSAISQFDVQALLLEYIKMNKLRDPRRKSQIICDARLQSLFGKPRVGHFEMLKLLESHFLINDDPQIDDNQGTVVDDESNELDIDTPAKGGKDKKRKTRKKGQNRERQSNLDDFAAVDMHNIGLIFLRRKLVEDLLEDDDSFCDKVVGTFVRIRISASTQKQDMYRLVQVLGTSKAAEPYKVGKRSTDLMLEILNLNKKELVSIDTISNQEFTEEECKRLRQSIKCGLTSRLTVGDILDKATEIQAARVSDWMESEIVRVCHLRDRASEKGRRKELRECVEKLQLLKTPEERRRRLDEVPEIHADPNMDPDHESEEHDSEEEDSKQDSFMKPRGFAFSRRGREPISPRGGNVSSADSWSGSRQNSGKNYEVSRNISNTEFLDKNNESVSRGGIPFEGALTYIETQQANVEKVMSPINSVNAGQSSISFARAESFSGATLDIPQPSLPAAVPEASITVNESEKMWHYKDPAGKVQGPFSIVQLRKWNKNGYFPTDLRIWKATESEDDSILLTNGLDGIFHKQFALTKTNLSPTHTVLDDQNLGSQSQIGTNPLGAWGSLSVEVPKQSGNVPNDSFNPPSPTPNPMTPGGNKEHSSEIQHSASSATVQTANLGSAEQNGNQENISPASLLNSARQLMSGFESGSLNSLASSGPVGPTIGQPTDVTNGTQGWGTQQMVVPNQAVASDPQAAVNAPTQNLDPNSSYSMPIQQQAGYNPWIGAVPPTVQAPPGSFLMPGYAAMPQPDQWRQPVPGIQPPFPNQVPPNVPWGMGMVQGNPNMGCGMGMIPGNPNMNWVPMVNPGWVATAGNPGAMVQTMPPGGNVNQGWVAQPVNHGGVSVAPVPPPGNMNPGWGPPPRTPGTNTQAPLPVPGNLNQGWGTGTPPSNPNSGMGNSGGWGTPPGNLGRRGNESNRSGNRFSGPRDRVGGQDRRPYQPSRYDSHGNRICPFFLDGYCKKGFRCDMVHKNTPD